MTHEPNSRRVSRNQRALSIMLTHCGASTPFHHSTSHHIPSPRHPSSTSMLCHALPCPALPSFPSAFPFPFPAQPSQPSLLGLNKCICQTAGALTLHEQMRPELCLHTSIVSDGGLSVLLPIHPQALHRITSGSSIVRRWRPRRRRIFITAREAIHARRHAGSGLLPAKPTAELTPSDVATEHQYQDPVHNNKPAACRTGNLTQFFGISERAWERGRVGLPFRNSSFARLGRRAASELLLLLVDSPLSVQFLAPVTPWELRIFVAEF